jgi:DNA-binding transcriptional MerR regulator
MVQSVRQNREAQLYTTAEVAAGFQVTTDGVRQWIKRGQIIPTEKANLRGDHRFSREEIERFALINGLVFRDPKPQPQDN